MSNMLKYYPTISHDEVRELFEYFRDDFLYGLTEEEVQRGAGSLASQTGQVGTDDDHVMHFLSLHLWQLENDWDVAGAVERVPLSAHPDWVRDIYSRADSHDGKRMYGPLE